MALVKGGYTMIAYGRTLCRSKLDKYFSLVLQSSYPLPELKFHINKIYKTVCLCIYIPTGCFCFIKKFFQLLCKFSQQITPVIPYMVRKEG